MKILLPYLLFINQIKKVIVNSGQLKVKKNNLKCRKKREQKEILNIFKAIRLTKEYKKREKNKKKQY